MRKAVLLAGLVGIAVAGCGDSKTLNTAPLTDEQKAASKAESRAVDDEELSGSGAAKGGRAKKGN